MSEVVHIVSLPNSSAPPRRPGRHLHRWTTTAEPVAARCPSAPGAPGDSIPVRFRDVVQRDRGQTTGLPAADYVRAEGAEVDRPFEVRL